MRTVDEYLALPWSVRGRGVREAPDAEPYYLITIDEMSGFSVVCDSRTEAESIFPIVLREYIEATLDCGHRPVVPLAIRKEGATWSGSQDDARVGEHMALPWSLEGRAIRDAEGEEPYYVITIRELPGFSVVGETRREALAELEIALATHLSGVLADGFDIKVPEPRLLASEFPDREDGHES
ncbi:type II toxin-antitoxin system HicB family antitoxin [Longimicrobium sp.]|uniref:type II toxin-antitoxin system HicB family antitoxin n=1 Tax=Longimicrobium sp. TaxID=2029185 RepID=UPI002EDB250D